MGPELRSKKKKQSRGAGLLRWLAQGKCQRSEQAEARKVHLGARFGCWLFAYWVIQDFIFTCGLHPLYLVYHCPVIIANSNLMLTPCQAWFYVLYFYNSAYSFNNCSVGTVSILISQVRKLRHRADIFLEVIDSRFEHKPSDIFPVVTDSRFEHKPSGPNADSYHLIYCLCSLNSSIELFCEEYLSYKSFISRKIYYFH